MRHWGGEAKRAAGCWYHKVGWFAAEREAAGNGAWDQQADLCHVSTNLNVVLDYHRTEGADPGAGFWMGSGQKYEMVNSSSCFLAHVFGLSRRHRVRSLDIHPHRQLLVDIFWTGPTGRKPGFHPTINSSGLETPWGHPEREGYPGCSAYSAATWTQSSVTSGLLP